MRTQLVYVCPLCDRPVIDDLELAEAPNPVQEAAAALTAHLATHVDEIVADLEE